MSEFWRNEIVKELSQPELLNLFEDPEQVIAVLFDTVAFVEANCTYPRRIQQYFKTLGIPDAPQEHYFAEKLELLLEENEVWRQIEYAVVENSSYNYGDKEQHEETYSIVRNWIVVKAGRKTEEDVQRLNETMRTIVNHPEFFITDVRERIKDLPYLEKLKYIEGVKHRFDLEINKIDFYTMLSSQTTHFYEDGFMTKCDAEIAYQKKLRAIELLEEKSQQIPQPVVEGLPVHVNKSHFARCVFEIIELLDGDISDKSKIARFIYFLSNGKEATDRPAIQHILNAISAENKQVKSDKAKANTATLNQYLAELRLTKHKL